MHRIGEVESTPPPDRPSARAAAAALGLLLATATAILVWTAFGDSPTADQARVEASAPPPEPVVTAVDIGHGGGIDVEVGEGGVWVTTRDAVLEVDPATNGVVKEIPLEAPFLLSIGEGSVWVTESIRGTLIRIDPRTGAVAARIEIPDAAYDVHVANGVVWVTAGGSNGGRLVRIDPQTNEIVASIHIGPGSGAGGLGGVAADDQAVWISRGERHDSLLRIDPDTNRIAARIDISNWDYWNQMALEDGSLWVATGPHVTLEHGTGTSKVQVLRIDPNTDEVSPPIVVGHGMFGLGAGDDFLWVYDGFHPNALTQVDPATGSIVRRIDIPDGGSSWGGNPGIDAADGTVWMAGTTSLNRIDLDPEPTS